MTKERKSFRRGGSLKEGGGLGGKRKGGFFTGDRRHNTKKSNRSSMIRRGVKGWNGGVRGTLATLGKKRFKKRRRYSPPRRRNRDQRKRFKSRFHGEIAGDLLKGEKKDNSCICLTVADVSATP